MERQRDSRGRFVKKSDVTKEFTLPKKWCLKVDASNVKEVGEWRTAGTLGPSGYVMYKGFYPSNPSVKGYWSPYQPEGTTLITTEQFREYVLGKIPKKWTLDVKKLKKKEQKIVGDYFTKMSTYSCYQDLSQFSYISSHNTEGAFIGDGPKMVRASFADFNKYKYITFSQFEKHVLNREEKKEKVPEKKKVNKKYTVEELKKVSFKGVMRIETVEQFQKMKDAGFFKSLSSFCGNYMYAVVNNSGYWSMSTERDLEREGYTILKFDQIDFEEKKSEKRIIGYTLIKPEYEEAAIRIAGYCKGGITPFKTFMESGGHGGFASTLDEAGVLHKWFKPIYESAYPVGSFILIKNAEVECRRGCSGIGNGVHKVVSSNTKATNGLLEGEEGVTHVQTREGAVWRIAPTKNCTFKIATAKEVKDYFDTPIVTIEGYAAQFDAEAKTVSFGCKTFNKKDILVLGDILRRSGLKIKEYNAEVLAVVKYFESHRK